jgi:uncharacterized protein (DUF924 family)
MDEEIRMRWQTLWQMAADGQLDHWQDTPEGCLALAIVLDQFPLNMFRGQPKSFATEAKAIQVSLHAVDLGFDRRIEQDRLAFLYMPLMHSENRQHQAQSVALFEAAGLEENARFARHHRQIVDTYGRFPHRNAILGRQSTPQEQAYLASADAFKG